MFQIDYWRRAAEHGIPTDRPLPQLLDELMTALRSPDAVVRDELAYDILSDWIGAGHCDHHLAEIGDRMAESLHIGLGECGTDSVFGRSFAALILSSVVLRSKTLSPHWYAEAHTWFLAERDLRGAIDEPKGVAHAPAHGADLIAAFARHPELTREQAVKLLTAIPARLADTAGVPLELAEDDRLAYAAMALLHRPDVTAADLAQAVAPLSALAKAPSRTDLHPVAHARINTLNWLRALYLQLDFGVRPMPWYDQDGHFDREPGERQQMLAVLRAALHERSFWFAPAERSTVGRHG